MNKVKRRLTYYAGKTLPFNSSLKPDGAYATAKDFVSQQTSQGARYMEIFPSRPSDINTNDAFYSLCNDFLRPGPIQSLPAAYVTVIPNGRLWMNIFGTNIAVISSDNKVIGGLTYQYVQPNVSARLEDSDIFQQKYFTKPTYYEGTVFSMLSGSRANDNYYHWLFDALPKLYLLKESGLFPQVDHFLIPSLSRKFQHETLSLLGVDASKLIEANEDIHIQADTLIATSFIRHEGHIPTWACQAHRKAFVGADLPDRAFSPFVYVGRGDSKIRQVLNEPELIQMLEGYGFKTYLLSKLSFAEQVKLFSSAKLVVSAHGAGLANLTFCKPGTPVIEFFPDSYIKPTYQIISKKAGLEYHYLICKSDAAEDLKITAANVEAGMELNIHADLDKIRQLVEGALAKEQRGSAQV